MITLRRCRCGGPAAQLSLSATPIRWLSGSGRDKRGQPPRRVRREATAAYCPLPDFTNNNSENTTFELYNHPELGDLHEKPPPRRFSEFDDSTLAIMASQRVHGAFKERLLREVMRRDHVEYADAYDVLSRINEENERLVWLYKLPYRTGIGATFIIGVVCLPCVFHRETALWFCETFVKEEIPSDPAVLDTMFKVGTWSWAWMEPIIGTASFALLCAQLMRNHMQKIDLKPFGRKMESHRADQLAKKFPEYEREIVRDYAKSDPWGRDNFIARQGHPANSVIPHRSS